MFERFDGVEMAQLTGNMREYGKLLKIGKNQSPRVSGVNHYADLGTLTQEIGGVVMNEKSQEVASDFHLNADRLPTRGFISDRDFALNESGDLPEDDRQAQERIMLLLNFLASVEAKVNVVIFSEAEITQMMLEDIKGKISERSKLVQVEAITGDKQNNYGDVIKLLRSM